MPSSLPRVLEPEVMDTWDEAMEYDAMDFIEVNTAFCEATLALVFLGVVFVWEFLTRPW